MADIGQRTWLIGETVTKEKTAWGGNGVAISLLSSSGRGWPSILIASRLPLPASRLPVPVTAANPGPGTKLIPAQASVPRGKADHSSPSISLSQARPAPRDVSVACGGP